MSGAMRANRPSFTPRSSGSTSGWRGRTTRTFLITRSSGVTSVMEGASARVVKDDAQRVAPAAQHTADAVAHGGAIPAAGALDRAVPGREDQDLALLGGDRLTARLGARPLLHQQELAALVVGAPAQEAGELQGKDDVAVDVLVQAVVAAGLVVEQQRGRLRLSAAMTDRDRKSVV